MLKEATEWLDGHQNGTKEEYDTKQKELESKILPLLTKGMDPSDMGGMPDMSGKSIRALL